MCRCLECTQSPPRCKACTVDAHRHLPLHWVDMWQGHHFKRCDLSSLGLVVQLGPHHGLQCPNIATAGTKSNLVVTHTNGLHEVCINWCQCPGRPDHVTQLMQAGYFPGTLDTPQSAFTIILLKEFHIHTLTSKKAAFDYVAALCRLSDNVFPATVKVCLFIFDILCSADRRKLLGSIS